MNPRALLVSYYFPPMGGAGTQRFAKFCRYLPAEGFDPVVVCSGSDVDGSAPHSDQSLRDELPPGLSVVRVPEPTRPTLEERLRSALRISMDGDRWTRAAIPAAIEAARIHRAKVVVTTTPPYGPYRVGVEVRASLGIPWLLDLRDPWALDGWRRYATPLHAAFDLRRMREALRSADAVIANTTAAADAYAELGAPRSRMVVIPNGFDPSDFGTDPVSRRQEAETIRIIHVGTLQSAIPSARVGDERLPKWTNRKLQYEGRSARFLILAMAALRTERPELARRLRLDLYGTIHPSNLQLARDSGIEELVTSHGYVSHGAAVQQLRQADIIFVPLHGVASGQPPLTVPGKVYEALASGRPVLAAIPDGDAADLVRATRGGVVCGPVSAAEVAAGILELQTARERRGEVLELFTRQRLTRSLASAMRDVLEGRQPSVADPFVAARAVLARG